MHFILKFHICPYHEGNVAESDRGEFFRHINSVEL